MRHALHEQDVNSPEMADPSAGQSSIRNLTNLQRKHCPRLVVRLFITIINAYIMTKQ